MTSMRYIILCVSILVLLLASHFHPISAHQHEHEDQRVLTSLARRILSLPTEFDTDNSSKIRVQIKKGMRFVPSSGAGAGAGSIRPKTRSSAAPTTTNRHVSSSLHMCFLLGFFLIFTDLCQIIEAEGALHYLIDSLKYSEVSESLIEKTLNIFARILDPSKEMKSKFYDEPVNGSKRKQDTTITTGSAGNMNEIPVSKPTSSLQTAHARDLLDSAALAHLVQILKWSSPNLQRKAASILEFVTMAEPCIDQIISVDIESSLGAVFQQKIVNDMEADIDCQQPELRALEIEEAGLAISAASRLLTRLLDFDKFRSTINPTPFITSLRKILTSSIPLHHKDWVAACLVKLSSLSGPNIEFENPISTEVTLYETIPRLIEQIENPSPEVQEAAVVELNRIIAEGVVDSTRAVAAEGGIFPLVKLIEEGTGRAVEAGLAILYNLSMDAENHSAIVAAGAVPALRRIILSQRPQWTRALHLLRTLPT